MSLSMHDILEQLSKLTFNKLNIYKQVDKYLMAAGEDIPFFKLVINPNDHEQTRRNALDVTYLYQMQLIGICIKDGLPFVYLLKAGDPKPKIMENFKPVDLCFCNEKLKTFSRMYDIKQPMIKRLFKDNEVDVDLLLETSELEEDSQ